jgi:hypothetical protein
MQDTRSETTVEAGQELVGFYLPGNEKRDLEAAADREAMTLSELMRLLSRAFIKTGKLPGQGY